MKPLRVQPLANGADHRGAHAQDGPLAGHADPQVAVIQGEIHAMLFERHRVILRGLLNDLQIL